MKKIFAIVILLCVIYFIVGWFLVYLEIFNENSYIQYASIVGALASITGLFSFTKPTLTTTELQEIEYNALESVTKTVKQLKTLKKEKIKTKEELGGLELQKKKWNY